MHELNDKVSLNTLLSSPALFYTSNTSCEHKWRWCDFHFFRKDFCSQKADNKETYCATPSLFLNCREESRSEIRLGVMVGLSDNSVSLMFTSSVRA